MRECPACFCRHFLEFFISAIDEWGPWGYAAYAAVYVALEVLAVPGESHKINRSKQPPTTSNSQCLLQPVQA